MTIKIHHLEFESSERFFFLSSCSGLARWSWCVPEHHPLLHRSCQGCGQGHTRIERVGSWAYQFTCNQGFSRSFLLLYLPNLFMIWITDTIQQQYSLFYRESGCEEDCHQTIRVERIGHCGCREYNTDFRDVRRTRIRVNARFEFFVFFVCFFV